MASYDEKEAAILNKIADEIVKLDKTCEKMDGTEGKIKHFIEQEIAAHEIKSIIRSCKKLEGLEEERGENALLDATVLEALKNENLKHIGETMAKLDTTLGKLEAQKDSKFKIKAFIYRMEALHEVKKILNKVGLYDSYNADELKDIAELNK